MIASQETDTRVDIASRRRPSVLACQHRSAYRGDGAALLRELRTTLEKGSQR